eukprot:COSAG02_NODE_61629_length_268_cov_0.609467_1_plen_34_part_01
MRLARIESANAESRPECFPKNRFIKLKTRSDAAE